MVIMVITEIMVITGRKPKGSKGISSIREGLER